MNLQTVSELQSVDWENVQKRKENSQKSEYKYKSNKFKLSEVCALPCLNSLQTNVLYCVCIVKHVFDSVMFSKSLMILNQIKQAYNSTAAVIHSMQLFNPLLIVCVFDPCSRL